MLDAKSYSLPFLQTYICTIHSNKSWEGFVDSFFEVAIGTFWKSCENIPEVHVQASQEAPEAEVGKAMADEDQVSKDPG
jgi:hypothetical protein